MTARQCAAKENQQLCISCGFVVLVVDYSHVCSNLLVFEHVDLFTLKCRFQECMSRTTESSLIIFMNLKMENCAFDYFNLTQKEGVVNKSLDTSWYKGDPIWLANERFEASRRSVSFYWPSGEASYSKPPHKPSLYREWRGYRNLSAWMTDVDDIVKLFTDEKDPINFLAWYIAEPDHTLHKNGFYNGELRKIIHQLDELFGYLVARLQDTGLENTVNVILTADHGHAEIQGAKNVMCLREYIVDEGYQLGDHMMYPDSEELALELYRNLSTAAKTQGFKVNVFLKEDVPKRFFYTNSSRIGRIVIEPEVGWAASFSKSCTREKLLETYAPGNIKFNSSSHGMDPDRWEMRAMLTIGGPSVVPGKKITDIPENIELHSLMSYLLAIEELNIPTMSVVSQALKAADLPQISTASFSESIAFTFLIIPSACIVVLFLVYICRHTVLSDNPSWMWRQGGYRPLHMDIFDAERHRKSEVICRVHSELFLMSLLPKSTAEFTDPKYWKNFFATRKTPFEWYGDYGVLGSVLEKYLKSSDNILQIGCGNSQMAAQMYDNGFRNIHSIDTDSAVIEKQRLRNRERSELVFSKDDATSMSFGDEDFSVVVDKGTLDALLPPEATEHQLDCVHKMFSEVQRVLKVAGRYLIITLAQHHIVKCFMEHFLSTRQFLLRVHEIENSASGFPMPVFILVATKLRNVMTMSMPVELCRAGSNRFEKLVHLDDVLAVIASEQELNQFVHMCSRYCLCNIPDCWSKACFADLLYDMYYSRKLDHEASITIESQFESGPRYCFHIVDDVNVKTFRSYAVFVVPLGRKLDHEASITIESQFESGPRYCFHIVDDVNVKTFRSYAVFVVPLGRVKCLCFREGEWIFSTEKGRRTLRQQAEKDRLAVVTLSRSQAYSSLKQVQDELGPFATRFDPRENGGLSYRAFMIVPNLKASVEGVELDRDVVNVAIQWFALPHQDDHSRHEMSVKKKLYSFVFIDEKEKLDVLFVDLAGPVHESGLSCPPAVFLTDPVLCNMKNSLKSNGVIAMNLVTRDEEVAQKAKRSVAAQFPVLFSIRSEEDVNEVLLACATRNENFNAVQFARSLRKDIRWVNALEPVIARITPVPLQ
ncbi:methyltransferase domain protein [Ostertagia ostertagi]